MATHDEIKYTFALIYPGVRFKEIEPVMAKHAETRIEDPLGDEDLEVPFKYAITAYGADFPVDGLIKRLGDKSIAIPEFQRGYVWTNKQASRFVESLLLGLPVPGIFLAREVASHALLVIDGQQRLRSLQYFYNGMFPQTERAFRLKGVQAQFEGKRYEDLSTADRRRLDDSIIHATVVKQDEPSQDQSSIYHIFERINTGGVQLHPQEIRTSIYHGSICMLLDELNQVSEWRDIYGPASKTMRDQELILRFFALLYYRKDYKRPMKDFLNKAMGRRRNADTAEVEEMHRRFTETISLIHRTLKSKAFRPKRALNAAVFDAVTVAVAEALASKSTAGRRSFERGFVSHYKRLLEDAKFQVAVNKSTADEEVVRRRLEIAMSIIR
jgi:hypothetical protein